MKKLYPLALLFLFTCYRSSAQNAGTVSGKLIDSVSQQILKGATLSILNPKDSSIISNQVSGDDGIFLVSNLALGNYVLKISFEG